VSTRTRSVETIRGVPVRLESLRRRYGSITALDGLDLELAPGELVALLGPSGCGKTTALRLLAGLEDADEGRVLVADRDLSAVPASKRDMGMVFQAYSLFPHLTARQNVEFGLSLRKVRPADRRRRAADMLDLVGLGGQADRFAHQMSGGQQQRVALARALAIEPQVLLLDEPLSALDAKVRVQLRDEIRRIQLELGITTLFVTHDQEEALAVADRVGVMRDGRLEQVDVPEVVYARPATPFVAEFVGLSNRIPAHAEAGSADVLGSRVPLLPGSPTDGAVVVLVRPEGVAATPDGQGDARVVAASFLGSVGRLQVRSDDGSLVVVQVDSESIQSLPVGSPVRLSARGHPALAVPRDR
jgi:putative spermidine/putrescine transport system ATP-binding protein